MRRRVKWLKLLVLLTGLFALNNSPQPAMAVTYCEFYCPSHGCQGPCYCRAPQGMSSCAQCPDICWFLISNGDVNGR